jgi:hypothetical protein
MELNSTRVIHHAQGVQKRTTQKEYKVKCLLPKCTPEKKIAKKKKLIPNTHTK